MPVATERILWIDVNYKRKGGQLLYTQKMPVQKQWSDRDNPTPARLEEIVQKIERLIQN